MTAIIHYSTFLLSKKPAKKLYCIDSFIRNPKPNTVLSKVNTVQRTIQIKPISCHFSYHVPLLTYLLVKKRQMRKRCLLSLICQIPDMHWIKYMFMYANTLLWNSDYTWRHNQTSIFLESVCLTLSWCGMLIHVLLETNLKKVMSLHLSLICQITLMYWVNTFLMISSIAMRHCVTRYKITYRCVSIDMFGLMYLTGLGLQKKQKRGYQ